MGRWFSWLQQFRRFRAFWHARLVILIFVGLQKGYLQKSLRSSRAAGTVAAGAVAAAAAPAGDAPAAAVADGGGGRGRVPVAQANLGVAKLPSACTNTMHMVTMYLLDPLNLCMANAVLDFCQPLQEEYAVVRKQQRSLQSASRGAIDRACGSPLVWVNKVVRLLSDGEVLTRCGFDVAFPLRDVDEVEAQKMAEQKARKEVFENNMAFERAIAVQQERARQEQLKRLKETLDGQCKSLLLRREAQKKEETRALTSVGNGD